MIFALVAGIIYTSNADNTVSLLRSDAQGLKLQLKLQKMNLESLSKKNQEFTTISIPGTYTTGQVGGPELPVVNRLIEIPVGAKVEASVTGLKSFEVSLKEMSLSSYLAPLQPSASKGEGAIEWAFKPELYKEFDAKRNSIKANVTILGQMRGKQLALVSFCPVNYNAKAGTLQQITAADITISFEGGDYSTNPALYSPYFENVYSQVINHRNVDPQSFWHVPVRYLIVTAQKYQSALAPFIEWKTQKGFQVECVNKEDIGATPEEIAAWVKARYDEATAENPAPTFLLLAGDVEDVPAFDGKYTYRKTDLYYASIDGDDYPEMFYGRFSASTEEEMENIVAKTIKYEQYDYTSGDFSKRAEFIAGVDEGNQWNVKVGEPTLHYAIDNYFNSANGFNDVEAYMGPYTGYDNRLNEGNAVVYYTGHGMETEWVDPKVTVDDVVALTNANMPSLVIANCCLSGDFGSPKSLSEAFLRNPNGGAIGYIGSSPTSYWLEDFYWGVGVFALNGNNDGYVPTVEESTTGVFDAMFKKDNMVGDAVVFYGNLAVTEAHTQGVPTHKSSAYYWEAYSYMGDPSVGIYLGEPVAMAASCRDIAVNADRAVVSGEEGAYVALSRNGVLLGAGKIGETGTVDIQITPVTEEAELDLVVTKIGKKPVITKANVMLMEDAFCQIENYVVKDTEGNIVEHLQSNSSYQFFFEIKNYGMSNGTQVHFTAEALNDVFSIDNAQDIMVGDIASGNSVVLDIPLNVTTAAFVDDQSIGNFKLMITDGTASWENNVATKIYAPKLQYSAFFKEKGLPREGQERIFVYEVTNIGHAELKDLTSEISLSGVDASFTNNTVSLANLPIGESAQLEYVVTFGNTDTYKRPKASLKIAGANKEEETMDYVFSYEVFEDFESGDLSCNNFSFSDEEHKWYVTNDDASQGWYSLRSPEFPDGTANSFSTVLRFDELSTISFAFYAEIEHLNDKFSFLIDGQEQQSWSGVHQWAKHEFQVEPGLHTFTWEFEKDASGGIGANAIWIDFIQTYGYSTYEDQEGPEMIDLKGNYTSFGDAFNIQVNLQDNHQVSTAKAITQRNGEIVTYDMTRSDRYIPMQNSTWSLNIPALSALNQGAIRFEFEDEKGNTSQSLIYPLVESKAKNVTEDFELETNTGLVWENEGDRDWQIEEKDGSFTYASGNISHNESTTIKLTEKWAIDGSVSFRFKISCEQVYDKLIFCIDGVEQNVWSGVYDWRTYPAVDLKAGVHTLSWTYVKDYDNSSATDMAWIDDLVLIGLDDNNVFPANDAPQFLSEAPVDLDIEADYNYTVLVQDADNDMLFLHAATLPYWMTLNYSEENGYTLSGSPVQAGKFDVVLHLSDGYHQVEQVFTVEVKDGSVGIDDINATALSVYPMPVKDILYLNMKCNEAVLMDVNGQQMLVERNCEQLNMSNIPAGVYLLKLNILDDIITKKIIKK